MTGIKKSLELEKEILNLREEIRDLLIETYYKEGGRPELTSFMFINNEGLSFPYSPITEGIPLPSDLKKAIDIVDRDVQKEFERLRFIIEVDDLLKQGNKSQLEQAILKELTENGLCNIQLVAQELMSEGREEDVKMMMSFLPFDFDYNQFLDCLNYTIGIVGKMLDIITILNFIYKYLKKK